MLMQSKMRPKGLFGAFAPGLMPNPAEQGPQMDPLGVLGERAGQMAQGMAGPAPQKPGFFGQGGFGRAMAGYLGDMLMQQSGFQPLYAPMMQSRAEAEAKARATQEQRDYEWSKWLKQKEWERDNPAPVNNDTINDYNWVLQTYGKEAADQYGQGVYDPIVNVQLPGGAVYSGPRSGLQSALGNAQQAPQQPQGQLKPVGKLRPVGGAGGNASGPFR